MHRTLRSKAKRNALLIAAKGICQSCSMKLDKSFHADHIVPWSLSKRTNMHEMQALCQKCNLKKGVSPWN
jgi:5-methylcytosine-specific restriction endonuclease McrA